MLFCHISTVTAFLVRFSSPDGNGILLYLVISTRYKRYSVQLEIASNKYSNFTRVIFMI